MKNKHFKFIVHLEKLSFQNKMKALFYSVLIIVSILLVSVSTIFISMVASETYKSNRNQLSVLSNDLKYSFSRINQLITDFHQDTHLQQQIELIDQPQLDSMEKDKILLNVDRELGWLVVNSRINSWVLFDNQQQPILGNQDELDQYIKNYKITDYLHAVKGDSQQGAWFFDRKSSKAVFIHNIFDTRKLIMRQIGTIIFTVDLSFVGDFMSDSGNFSTQDFIVLSHKDQYYATIPARLTTAKSFLKRRQQTNYQFATIDRERYYVMSDPITIDNTTFDVNYFILNRQIVQKILGVTIVVFVVILIVILACIQMANYFLRRLIMPINILASDMQQFSTSKDLTLLHRKVSQVDLIHQQDEIGTLYTSFRRLLDEIDRLVIKDYQSQLLTQTMETKYLMAQIDPHFLYNTLNSINWIALSQNDTEVSEVVTSLALLLREKTDSKKQFHSLADELEIVSAYIKIQSVRFGKRLRFSMTVSEEIQPQKIQIPKLIIQPIVENAVKYGVEKIDRPVVIEVSIQLLAKKLQIVVFNDGDGFDPKTVRSESTGVGIHNIISRLKLRYNNAAGLKIQSAPKELTTVIIWLPIE